MNEGIEHVIVRFFLYGIIFQGFGDLHPSEVPERPDEALSPKGLVCGPQVFIFHRRELQRVSKNLQAGDGDLAGAFLPRLRGNRP